MQFYISPPVERPPLEPESLERLLNARHNSDVEATTFDASYSFMLTQAVVAHAEAYRYARETLPLVYTARILRQLADILETECSA